MRLGDDEARIESYPSAALNGPRRRLPLPRGPTATIADSGRCWNAFLKRGRSGTKKLEQSYYYYADMLGRGAQQRVPARATGKNSEEQTDRGERQEKKEDESQDEHVSGCVQMRGRARGNG